MSGWHLTNCLLLILLLLYRYSKSFHTSFSENIQRWEQVSFCSIIVLAGIKKVEWADHVLPICQLITVNRCLKENCSYFTQHWKLKVHVSSKDGHGNNRLFYLQKTSLCCPVGGSYLLCTCDLGLIWICWCSLKRTWPSVWACLPEDTEM